VKRLRAVQNGILMINPFFVERCMEKQGVAHIGVNGKVIKHNNSENKGGVELEQ
jgi:hypothetical protein